VRILILLLQFQEACKDILWYDSIPKEWISVIAKREYIESLCNDLSVAVGKAEILLSKLMKTMNEGFYKMNTAVSLVDYEKAESENCSWCKYREGCL
jgi:hypothetical protein